MWNFLCFYGRCLKTAGKGVLGVIGDCGTILGIGLAIIASVNPPWFQNRATSAEVNAIGGWMVPIVLLASISIVRLILSPYWIFKEERDRSQLLQNKLNDYDATPIFPVVEPHSNGEHITIKITNKGKEEEPVESVALYLSDGNKNEKFALLKPTKNEQPLPLTIPRKKHHRVTFDLCGAHCLQWGVKSIYAVVKLQDDREREGDPYTVRSEGPLDQLLVPPVSHAPDRTWQESMTRNNRIWKVADGYNNSYLRRDSRHKYNGLRELDAAQIHTLKDGSEVSELLAVLKYGVDAPHPFINGEDAGSILRFYRERIPRGFSIGGIPEWTAAYNEWFGVTPPSSTPDTGASSSGPVS